jgi:hypothetical protein
MVPKVMPSLIRNVDYSAPKRFSKDKSYPSGITKRPNNVKVFEIEKAQEIAPFLRL